MPIAWAIVRRKSSTSIGWLRNEAQRPLAAGHAVVPTRRADPGRQFAAKARIAKLNPVRLIDEFGQMQAFGVRGDKGEPGALGLRRGM